MTTTSVPDSEVTGWMKILPAPARPFALLARFDRPIGWWLLFWPCAAGLALAGGLAQGLNGRWDLLIWFLLGSIAMRGAGCVYNDIVDRDLDKRVARTATRPLASGAVGLKAAWAWLFCLCLIGLLVLVQLNVTAILIAMGSLALVAAYPFMKRITWWPQAWLGLVFSWGALVAWVAIDGAVGYAMWPLYFGCMLWTIGYDTIYALQDVEDDALVGIRSSARALAGNVKPGVAAFYTGALGAWASAIWLVHPDTLALLALLPVALHLAWQITTLKPGDALDPLNKFRSNRMAGGLLFLACVVVGSA